VKKAFEIFSRAIFRTTKFGKNFEKKKLHKICKFQNDFIVLIFNELQLLSHFQTLTKFQLVITL